jgi:hypothetical protein
VLSNDFCHAKNTNTHFHSTNTHARLIFSCFFAPVGLSTVYGFALNSCLLLLLLLYDFSIMHEGFFSNRDSAHLSFMFTSHVLSDKIPHFHLYITPPCIHRRQHSHPVALLALHFLSSDVVVFFFTFSPYFIAATFDCCCCCCHPQFACILRCLFLVLLFPSRLGCGGGGQQERS